MRPKLKPELTAADKTLEAAGWIALATLWILTAIFYSRLPETIPVHFDFSGNPDRTGSKAELFIIVSVTTVVIALLTLFNRYPQIFNYIVPITEENALRQYRLAMRLMRVMKFLIAAIFILIMVSVYNTVSDGRSFNGWIIGIVLGMLITPVVIYFVISIRIR